MNESLCTQVHTQLPGMRDASSAFPVPMSESNVSRGLAGNGVGRRAAFPARLAAGPAPGVVMGFPVSVGRQQTIVVAGGLTALPVWHPQQQLLQSSMPGNNSHPTDAAYVLPNGAAWLSD
jgi:hypothetical protein